MKAELTRAVDLALDGKWDASHGIVQEYESDPMASWIHALLHKVEGDRSNSLYWYRRAGKMEFADHEATAELKLIRIEINKD